MTDHGPQRHFDALLQSNEKLRAENERLRGGLEAIANDKAHCRVFLNRCQLMSAAHMMCDVCRLKHQAFIVLQRQVNHD